MRLSELGSSISTGVISPALRGSLDVQIPKYQAALLGRGAVVPIHAEEDEVLKVGASEIKALCQFFLDGSLSAIELAYIADVLQLAESVEFANGFVADCVSEFTDPEINGEFTRQRAKEIARHNDT